MGRMTWLHGGRSRAAIPVTGAAVALAALSGAALPAQGSTAQANVHAIPAGYQDWSEHRHDALHSGVSGETFLSTSTSFKQHWGIYTGNAKSYSSPVVVWNSTLGESLVYVGNQGGIMSAYNASTGAPVWQYKVVKTTGLSKEIESSPAVSNNTLYFGDGDYHEYALNATTGQLICKSVSTGGVIASSAVIGDPNGHGDVVYFGDAGPSGSKSDGGHLWAMYGVGNTDGAACATKWIFDSFVGGGGNTGSGVYSTPAYGTLASGAPVVVVGGTDPDNNIWEFDANTGNALWHWYTCTDSPSCIDADVGAPPTIAEPGTVGASGSDAYTDGVVYDTGKDAILWALDLRTGQPISAWKTTRGNTVNGGFPIKKRIGHGNPAQSGAALVNGYLYEGYGYGVFSVNAATGALNTSWASGPKPGTTVATPGVVSSPSVTGPAGNRVLVVGDMGGNVDVYNLQTGAQLATFCTGPSNSGCSSTSATQYFIFASAGISTGQFFISNGGDGYLDAFGS